MITSSSPGASVGTGELPDGKSKGAQANIKMVNNIRSGPCALFFMIYLFYQKSVDAKELSFCI
jgi:hypothetical protein